MSDESRLASEHPVDMAMNLAREWERRAKDAEALNEEMAELLQAVAFDEHGSLQHWMVDLYATDPYVKLLADKATALLQRIQAQETDPE